MSRRRASSLWVLVPFPTLFTYCIVRITFHWLKVRDMAQRSAPRKEVGKMAQRARAFAAHAEDPVLDPSTYIHGGSQASITSIPGSPIFSSDLKGAPGIYVVHIHKCRKNILTHEIKKNSKKCHQEPSCWYMLWPQQTEGGGRRQQVPGQPGLHRKTLFQKTIPNQ